MSEKEAVVLDNPFAPEYFASAATGFLIINDNISITFDAPRVDHSKSAGTTNNVVAVRIVMPIGGAQRLAVKLFNYLETHGHALRKRPAQ